MTHNIPSLTFGAVLAHKSPKTAVPESNKPRPIHVIAYDIKREWIKPYFGAVPYLDAMCTIQTIDDYYGMDDAKSIILYFLANASSFRGDKARELKAELKKIAGVK